MGRSRLKIDLNYFEDVKLPKTEKELHVLLAQTWNEAFQEGWSEGYYDGQEHNKHIDNLRTLD